MNDDHQADLRARLLAVALGALERGDEIGLRAVAREAGVSAMAPYRHFRDKNALLSAVAHSGFTALRAALREADAQATPHDALIAQGQAYIAFARQHPALFRLMFAKHDGGPPPVDDNAYGVMVRRIQEIAPHQLEAAILACWSTVHGIATLALDGSLPDTRTAQERAAIALVVRGLSASGRDQTPRT